jgi:hypothetical protein
MKKKRTVGDRGTRVALITDFQLGFGFPLLQGNNKGKCKTSCNQKED